MINHFFSNSHCNILIWKLQRKLYIDVVAVSLISWSSWRHFWSGVLVTTFLIRVAPVPCDHISDQGSLWPHFTTFLISPCDRFKFSDQGSFWPHFWFISDQSLWPHFWSGVLVTTFLSPREHISDQIRGSLFTGAHLRVCNKTFCQ
jgi:hypothetical protein